MITKDPLRIRAGRVDMQIGLGAERIIAAERGEEKIAVEIKSFISPSNISEFHMALGQFLNYRVALEEQQPERVLYLAVPLVAYQTFLTCHLSQPLFSVFNSVYSFITQTTRRSYNGKDRTI